MRGDVLTYCANELALISVFKTFSNDFYYKNKTFSSDSDFERAAIVLDKESGRGNFFDEI